MPSAGAAMWMPTRMLPSSRHSTDSASSISVVASSSIEKARTVLFGSSGGSIGSVTSANPVPRGKYSSRKVARWKSSVDGIAPQRSISRNCDSPVAAAASSSALYSSVFLSGAMRMRGISEAYSGGRRKAASSAARCACRSAASRFFSSPALAAASVSAGAGR